MTPMTAPLTVKHRDTYSIETKLRYDAGTKKRTDRFRVSYYLFFPKSFEISRTTYGPSDLIDQLRSHLRFNTPYIGIDELIDPLSEISPLARAERIVHSAEQWDDEGWRRTFIHETKLLGCVYKSILRDFYLSARRQETTPPTDVSGIAKNLHHVAKRFHALRSSFLGLAQLGEEDAMIMKHVDIVDEHLSLLVGKYLTLVLRLWKRSAADGEYRRIAGIVQKEEKYRDRKGYPSVPGRIRTERQMEEYVYREKMLKRYVTEALLFSVDRTNTIKRTEHILYAIAAGIAMVVATGVAFFGQQRYGNFTTALFVLLVVGYMVKDRVKESFRAVLMQRIGSIFPLRKTVLRDSKARRRLAIISERTNFREERHLPAEVVALRNRGYFEQVVFSMEKERVLVYQKRVRLKSRNLGSLHSRVTSVADVATLDLRPFLQKLGIQYGLVPMVENKRHVRPRVVQRIYHCNLIIEFSKNRSTVRRRYRLVVDAGGIKRLESVSSDFETRLIQPRLSPNTETSEDPDDTLDTDPEPKWGTG